MYTMIRYVVATCGVCVGLLGCGGGTTGTSPTGGAVFSGVVLRSSGALIPQASMEVTDGASSSPIATSDTSSTGTFKMVLPSSIQSFAVSVEGAAPGTVRRSFGGASHLAGRIVVDDRQTVNVGETLEAKLDERSECEDLSIDGNEILILRELGDRTCSLGVFVKSSQPGARIVGEATGFCPDRRVVAVDGRPTGPGSLAFDLGQIAKLGCVPSRISLSTVGAERVEVGFDVGTEF
jgi:hypothetical protein